MYQALYRKYRPKVFSDVVGQDHITTTLKNEIKLDRIAHAYLFTGTRGTGKTTCAKIFAKAVNCENPHDGEPCCECDTCLGIENESILDVVEMDAASNSGVANMREIIEDIRRAPMMTKRKVYIIDEVHALSADAFTALLKTLEEPPTDTVFILATTEVHKLSATILSRCQRFDFRRVHADTIAGVLSAICEKQGIPFDGDAVFEVARLGDGSVRDSLSILERCISAGERLTRSRVLDVVGIAGDDMLMDFMRCFLEKDLTGALSILDIAYAAGKDIGLICERLIWMCRCVLVAKSGAEGKKLISDTQSNSDAIIAFSGKAALTEVLLWAKILSETLDRLPRSTSRRVMFEMCLIRLCERNLSSDENSLAMRISKLEEAIESGAYVRAPDTSAEYMVEKAAELKEKQKENIPVLDETSKLDKEERIEEAKPSHTEEHIKEQEPVIDADNASTSDTADENEGLPFGRFSKVIAAVNEKDPMTGGMLKGTSAYIYKTHLEIICQNEFTKNLVDMGKKLIESIVEKQLGRKIKVETVVGEPKKTTQAKTVKEPDPLDSLTEYDEDNNISFDDF